MSHTDPAPADPHPEVARAAPDGQYTQSMTAFGKLVERITPWLFDVGSWIFGGLIAFNLLVVASLITVGPVDPAIMVSTTAFALALPLNVTGLVLPKLIQDLKQVGFEEELAQAFQEAGLTVGEQVASGKALEALRTRRTRVVLGYSLGILALSAVLTVTGMIAALWHMAWWIGVAFFAMVLISPVVVVIAMGTSQPPGAKVKMERKRRDGEESTRQAIEQGRKNEERA